MAGVKGPRPCLGLLGKGDWPLSTRAYPRTETLTYSRTRAGTRATGNRPSTNSAASSPLLLALHRAVTPFSDRTIRRSLVTR